MITQEELQKVVFYNPETGVFINRLKRPPCFVGKILGTKDPKGYIRIGIYKKTYTGHKLAWLYVYGNLPTNQIDHINGIKDDNRIENLRDIPPQWNTQNQHKAPKNSNTGFLGVSWCKQKNKFRACITVNGKQKHLGFFQCKQQASIAYESAKCNYHDGYVKQTKEVN